MIKTLSKAQKMEREKFRIPRSVQDAIPIRRIFADGIFQVGNQYSKTWSFTDINYAIASKEDKTSMFLDYSELLNALDSGASAKITIYNRRINKAEFERSVLLPDKDDGLDEYRHEFNQMLTAQVTGTSNSIVRERYLTVSVVKRNADEARSYFARVGTDLVTHLAQLSSAATELTLNERLHIFRDFFKAGEQVAAEFNIHEHAKRGQHFKDWFCPDSMEFAADHFKLDARYGRVLYLQDYASYIKDSFVSELCDLDRDLMLSIDILPVPTDEAARQLQSTLLGVETNVANWQRRQNANNNFTATIPYDMELQRKETKEMLDDLTTRDQRMMFGLVTLVHLADSKEQLDSDTETLYSTARKHLCQLSTLRWQQKDGLDTVLPYGLRKIQALRTLTTESTAVLIPFRAQEIMQPNGLYYGQNAVSKNMIVADRRLLLNGNSFRLGVSGSGKSMSAKEEIVQIALSTEDDILILDPESEFGYLTEALGGEVIRIYSTYTETVEIEADEPAGDENTDSGDSSKNPGEDTESGNGTESAAAKTVTQTVLLIELTHKTPDEMAQDYAYTARQQEYLDLLRAPEYETLWAELLGGFLSGGGEILAPAGAWQSTGPLQWPLPITGSITSPFGYRTDPITGEVSYHSGTDIAAPAGTPILAAADGTVIVANGVDSWGGSYGYYVKLDHGGGLQTLYAHCQTICVTAGQQVQAGQVIGYVGHTGRATGDHLHFEIVENGQRQGRPS